MYKQRGMCTGLILLGCKCISGSVFTHLKRSTCTYCCAFVCCFHCEVFAGQRVFIYTPESLCEYLKMCTCVNKQDISENIYLGCIAQCVVAAE